MHCFRSNMKYIIVLCLFSFLEFLRVPYCFTCDYDRCRVKENIVQSNIFFCGYSYVFVIFTKIIEVCIITDLHFV